MQVSRAPQSQGLLQGPSQGASGAVDASDNMLTHGLLAEFSSLWVVGLRISVPHFMLVRGLPQFRAS